MKPLNFVVSTNGQDVIYPAVPPAKAVGTKFGSGSGFTPTGRGTSAEPFSVDLQFPGHTRWVQVAVVGMKTAAGVSGYETEETLAVTPLIDMDEFTGNAASKAP